LESSNELKLKVYALYKQANTGDVQGAQPWAVQLEARAKWDAHKLLEGMSSDDAKAGYVKEVISQARSLDLHLENSPLVFLRDTQVSLSPYFKVKDLAKFQATWKKATDTVKAEDDSCLYYNWTFYTTEDGATVAHCNESYANGEAVLAHLQMADAALKECLAESADIERLEVHGPAEEIEKLKEALAPMGCKFFAAEWGFSEPQPAEEDKCVYLVPYWTLKDAAAFKSAWKSAYNTTVTRAAEEKTAHYAFCFEGDTAMCRECYADADALLAHVGNVTPVLEATAAFADILRMELHGPKDQLEKLKPAFEAKGALFFETAWGFRK
jgi:acyl-CoA-binding protein/quinol monooxygenase YgiN